VKNVENWNEKLNDHGGRFCIDELYNEFSKYQTADCIGEEEQMTNTLTQVIGFDFGDAETALSKLSVGDHLNAPEEIFTIFAPNYTGVITTAIGYQTDGQVLIGLAAESSRSLRKGGLHISFKKKPVQGDHAYAQIVTDYINVLFDHLYTEKLLAPSSTKIVIGHPSKWKNEPGNPIGVLKNILAQTKIADSAAYELVPESRGAMVEAIHTNLFTKNTVGSGWALVIDLGSSTCDFTVVNLSLKTSKPLDFGEELGARLIDRSIQEIMTERSNEHDDLDLLFNKYPEEKVRFQLKCRDYKERFFAGQDVVEVYKISQVDQRKHIYIDIELTTSLMDTILAQRPIFELSGRQMSWKQGFKKILQNTKAALAKDGVNDVKVILLTGGASKMGFVKEICSDVFPSIQIERSGKPQFTIANGLARWGRIEIHTSQFTKDIEKFCSETIRPEVSSRLDSLYSNLASVIANRVIDIIKHNFDSWKRGDYRTINRMRNHIDAEVDSLMQEKNLSELFRDQILPILADIANKLAYDIKGLENKYNVPIGFLGASFDAYSLDVNRFSFSPQSDIDATDGMADNLGNVIGWISGILASVVTYIVTPIVLVTILNTVAVISTTLASLIFSILISNPAGWVILAGIGVAGIVAGAEAKEAIVRNLPSWDLPQWVRNMVKESSIYSKIDQKRSEIVSQVIAKLKEDRKIGQQLTDKMTKAFRKSLVEKAEDARMLIS